MRAVRWATRRPALTAVYGLVLVVGALAAAGAGAAWLWQRAEYERGRAEDALAGEVEARDEAARLSYIHSVGMAQGELRANSVARAEELLEGCPVGLRHWEWHYVKRQCQLTLRTLKGHTREVFAVAFSSDGRRIASGGADKTIKLWDLDGGQPLTLEGHTGYVTGLAFSPVGQQLASTAEDGTLKLWSLRDGVALTLEDRDGTVHGVAYNRRLAFSPDGRRLASTSHKQIKLWDATTGRLSDTLPAHTENPSDSEIMQALALSPDGRRIASATHNSVRIMDLEGGKPTVYAYPGTRAMAFSPDGLRLAIGFHSGSVQLWNLGAATPFYVEGHSRPVRSVAFSRDGRRLASGSEDSTVKVWDLGGREPRTLRGHTRGVISVAISPDGRRIASASQDRTVKVWDLDVEEPRTLKGHTRPVISVAFSPDGRLASASFDGTVKVRNVRGGELLTIKACQVTSGDPLRGMAISPDGRLLATSDKDGTLKLWDAATGRLTRTLTRTLKGQLNLNLVFSPDGQYLAGSAGDGRIELKRLSDGESRILTGLGRKNSIDSSAFSPDGRRLASLGDKSVKAWDTVTGQLALVLPFPTQPVQRVTFIPDGRVAVSSVDGIVKLLDLGGTKELTLKGHSGPVSGLASSPDGRRLATASYDGTLRLWDTASGRETLSLSAVGFAGWSDGSLAFSPDGRHLAAAVGNGDVKVWSLGDDGKAPDR